jgi:hypothetical protein
LWGEEKSAATPLVFLLLVLAGQLFSKSSSFRMLFSRMPEGRDKHDRDRKHAALIEEDRATSNSEGDNGYAMCEEIGHGFPPAPDK